MAEIVLAAVINKITDIAGNLIVEKGSRLSWLQEDINWIEREMRHIQSYLKDASDRRATSHGVANLIKDIEELALDIDDVMDIFLPQMESSMLKKESFSCLRVDFCLYPHAETNLKFVKEMEKIRRRVADIDRVRNTYQITDTTSSEGHSWDLRASFLHFDQETVIGLEEETNMLGEKLLSEDQSCNVISIVGMPGLGKTTLAKRIFKFTRQRFQCSAMIYVSQQPNIRTLFLEIAEQVGLPEEKREKNLDANLYAFLMEKRYVIFLDDIWNSRTWDALNVGIPCTFGYGSRIIVTSRNTSVGRYIGGESSLHELKPLDSEKSWRIFSDLMTLSSPINNHGMHDAPELEGLGKKIVEKCGGVPLAIAVTAGILREKERSETEWGWVLRSMGKDGEDDCSKIIALSYEDLPQELRPCFLYFGHFPEDYAVSAAQIINMWIAEKFIRVKGVHEPEHIGEDYLNKLVSRNLIQIAKRRFDGRIQSCRIHDLLHSFCIIKSKETNFFYTLDNVDSVHSVRRLSMQSGNIKPHLASGFRASKLRSLLCFDEHQELKWKEFNVSLGGFKFLCVLNVESQVFQRCIPGEITNLSHLHYLRLKTSHTTVASNIINLTNLQTLELVLDISGPIKFPAACVWKMKKLRHLILRRGRFTISCFLGVCNIRKMTHFCAAEACLTNLQTLCWVEGRHLCPNWLSQFANLRKLGLVDPSKGILELLSNDSFPAFPKLEKLRLFEMSSLDTRKDEHQKHLNLSGYHNITKLELLCIKVLPNVDDFPPNLIKLRVWQRRFEEDPMQKLKNLPKLKILQLEFDYYKGKWLNCSGTNSFPQLEVLHINISQEAEFLGTDEGMPKLRKVTITGDYDPLKLPNRLKNLSIREYL